MAYSIRPIALAAAVLIVTSGQVAAQGCGSGGDFGKWLNEFAREAISAGVSERAVRAGLGGASYQPSVIKRDRSQGVFAQSFLQFSSRMVAQYRLDGGRQKIKKHANLFSQIESRYGVPAAVITAFWGLETDFGAVQGKFSTIRSLATLAYVLADMDGQLGQ